jgi:hypothetical protein
VQRQRELRRLHGESDLRLVRVEQQLPDRRYIWTHDRDVRPMGLRALELSFGSMQHQRRLHGLRCEGVVRLVRCDEPLRDRGRRRTDGRHVRGLELQRGELSDSGSLRVEHAMRRLHDEGRLRVV